MLTLESWSTNHVNEELGSTKALQWNASQNFETAMIKPITSSHSLQIAQSLKNVQPRAVSPQYTSQYNNVRSYNALPLQDCSLVKDIQPNYVSPENSIIEISQSVDSNCNLQMASTQQIVQSHAVSPQYISQYNNVRPHNALPQQNILCTNMHIVRC